MHVSMRIRLPPSLFFSLSSSYPVVVRWLFRLRPVGALSPPAGKYPAAIRAPAAGLLCASSCQFAGPPSSGFARRQIVVPTLPLVRPLSLARCPLRRPPLAELRNRPMRRRRHHQPRRRLCSRPSSRHSHSQVRTGGTCTARLAGTRCMAVPSSWLGGMRACCFGGRVRSWARRSDETHADSDHVFSAQLPS